MRELPEAVVQAAQCADLLGGKVIAEARVGESEHKFTWYNAARPDGAELLAGKQFSQAAHLGGMLEMRFGDARVALVDGASPRYWPTAEEAPAKRHLYLAFTDGSALSVTTAMYGGIMIFGDEGLDNDYYRMSAEKPSPLTEAFDEARFDSLREGLPGKTSMKALLATEQRIPGLGNGVLQDILFAARLHPKRRMDDTGAEEYHAMYIALKRVLGEMAALGGRDVEKDLRGRDGGYKTLMSRLTLGKPCPVCGAPIEKTAYLGGAVYFCPVCQPLR